jgi:hypothetical protein
VLRRCRRADVTGDDGDPIAARIELAPCGGEDFPASSGEDDGGPLLEEAGCRGSSNSATAASDDGDPVLELVHHVLLPVRL